MQLIQQLSRLLEQKEEEKVYPNTKVGALQALQDMAQKKWVQSLDLDTAVVMPDRGVQGVWIVDSVKTGERVVVYLAGYKEPLGQKRETNDFEAGEVPKDVLKNYKMAESAADLRAPQKTLDVIKTIMKFDGDIPLNKDGTKAGKESGNQADKILEEGGSRLYYVSINPPHGDCEAYVVCNSRGEVSYYDFSTDSVVVDNKIVSERATRTVEDAVEDVIQEYEFESGHAKPGAIKAFLDVLKTAD